MAQKSEPSVVAVKPAAPSHDRAHWTAEEALRWVRQILRPDAVNPGAADRDWGNGDEFTLWALRDLAGLPAPMPAGFIWAEADDDRNVAVSLVAQSGQSAAELAAILEARIAAVRAIEEATQEAECALLAACAAGTLTAFGKLPMRDEAGNATEVPAGPLAPLQAHIFADPALTLRADTLRHANLSHREMEERMGELEALRRAADPPQSFAGPVALEVCFEAAKVKRRWPKPTTKNKPQIPASKLKKEWADYVAQHAQVDRDPTAAEQLAAMAGRFPDHRSPSVRMMRELRGAAPTPPNWREGGRPPNPE